MSMGTVWGPGGRRATVSPSSVQEPWLCPALEDRVGGEALGCRHPGRWAHHIPVCSWGVGAVPQHGIAESHLLFHGAASITILCWQGPFLPPQVLVGL